ncbi:MAG: DUF502 domain-containing protein [Phycisphaerales bacterium]|nr:DUF502 domain-containing protein [Phycisphaerales bacterium]
METKLFKHGLAALAPTILTIALLVWGYRFIDQNIARYITRGVVAIYSWGGDPHPWLGIDDEAVLQYGDPIDSWNNHGRRETAQFRTVEAARTLITSNPAIRSAADRDATDAKWEIATRKWKFFNLIGFLIAFLLIYFTGYLLASFVGRRTWQFLERALMRVPFIKSIYPNIKQVTDMFISDKPLEFAGVVAVEYPRVGIWSVGLVTGPPMRPLRERDERELVTVFIPSSPTPFMGYTITVARADIMELPISIDEALRYIISGGIVRPGETRAGDRVLAAVEA